MTKDRPVPNFIAKRMYNRHSLNRLEKEMKLLNSNLINPGESILDIGCGPGHLSIEMARITGTSGIVYALDIHPLAIKCVEDLIISNDICNVNTILTRTLETGLLDQSIDIIFIFNSYDMIRNKKRLHNEIKRILKPDGRLVISNKKHLLTSAKRFKKLYDKDENMCFNSHEKCTYFYKKSV